MTKYKIWYTDLENYNGPFPLLITDPEWYKFDYANICEWFKTYTNTHINDNILIYQLPTRVEVMLWQCTF